MARRRSKYNNTASLEKRSTAKNISYAIDDINKMNISQLNEFISIASKRANARISEVAKSGSDYQNKAVAEMLGKFGDSVTTLSRDKSRLQFARKSSYKGEDINIARHAATALRDYLTSTIGSNAAYKHYKRETARAVKEKYNWDVSDKEAEKIIEAMNEYERKHSEKIYGSKEIINIIYLMQKDRNLDNPSTDALVNLMDEIAQSKQSLARLQFEIESKTTSPIGRIE